VQLPMPGALEADGRTVPPSPRTGIPRLPLPRHRERVGRRADRRPPDHPCTLLERPPSPLRPVVPLLRSAARALGEGTWAVGHLPVAVG
jgi:hypothetical protein